MITVFFRTHWDPGNRAEHIEGPSFLRLTTQFAGQPQPLTCTRDDATVQGWSPITHVAGKEVCEVSCCLL